MEIEKNIAFFINQQFPAIYRQDGPELVQLVKDYYKFLEEETNQSNYVSRRLFDYKDVDTTIKEMLIFFKNKFLADLPLRENIVPFLVKNILDLYRRKGTPAGIELFFSIFFNEYDIEISYPAEKMLKVSNSKWRRGVYLQLFPNNNYFLSKTEKAYTYADLISRNILGSISGARAAVSRINYINIDGAKTPVIYIDEAQGNFTRYDDVLCNINGELVSFGVVNGSLSAFDIDESYPRKAGNEVGDVFDLDAELGLGGKVIVTEVSDSLTGEITYEVENGGYGYTVENTRLLVSNQTIILDNAGLDFVPYERLRDSAGNEGIVIGQSISAVGVLMDPGDEFEFSRPISTLDRSPNITLNVQGVPAKNDSSPGTLYPDGGDALIDVIVDPLSYSTNIEVITDVISPFVGVSINAADYETAGAMSGTASPVNLSTPLDEAFDIQTLTIGKIVGFKNINPGSGYENDVFARAEDSVIRLLQRQNQIIRFASPADAGVFSIGEIVNEQTTNVLAEVKAIDIDNGLITITPFGYYGFDGINRVVRSNSDSFEVAGVEIDYNSDFYGDNAIINSTTEFSTGKIQTVAIQNSGFGYIDGEQGFLKDADGVIQAAGTVSANTQGFTEGYWSDFSSHLNGFIQRQPSTSTPIRPTSAFATQVLRVAVGLLATPPELQTWGESTASDGFAYFDMNKNGSIQSSDAFVILKLAVNSTNLTQDEIDRWNDIVAPSLKEQLWFETNSSLYSYVAQYDYFTSGMRIQDSDFYQEYSYQIKSSLSKELYEKQLKDTVHLAGTKMFGDFIYKVEIASEMKPRFTRFFNDDGRGSPLDIANTDLLEASVTNFTVDTTFVTADHEPI